MTTVTATGSGSVTAPAGATTVDVEAWGSGGSSNGTFGGGGGGYAGSFGIAVTAGVTNIFYSVAVGGTAGGNAGNISWINVGTNSAPTLSANGAKANGGGAGTSAGAPGASTTGDVGTVLWAGGNGDSSGAGYGGGGAGSGGNGGNGSDYTGGGAGGVGGVDDGRGGGAGGAGGNVGTSGSAPGGGNGNTAIAAGANGQVRYTFHISNIASLATTEAADAVNIHVSAGDFGTLAVTEAADAGSFIVAAISSGTLAVSETPDAASFTTAFPNLGAFATIEVGDAGGFVAAQSGTGTVVATEVGDAGGFFLSTIAAGTFAVGETADAAGFVATEIASGILATTEVADTVAVTVAPPSFALAATESADAGAFVVLAGASGILVGTEVADAATVNALAGAFGALIGTEAGDAAAFSFISFPIDQAAFSTSEAPDFAAFSASIAGIAGMMLGDVENFRQRLRRLMPATWFPNPAPVLWGAISGVAYVYSSTYSLLKYAKQQMRMATTSDAFLDIAAMDYCGTRLQRRPGENDTSFRERIVEEVLRIRNTRNAIEIALMQLTGRVPEIFEPWNTADTGAYNKSAFYTGNGPFAGIGHYGNLSLPFAVFVNAFRPLTPEALSARNPAQVSQFLAGAWPYPCVANVGDVGLWAIPYAIFLPTVTGLTVSDAEIYAMVSNVKAAGITAWVNIQN